MTAQESVALLLDRARGSARGHGHELSLWEYEEQYRRYVAHCKVCGCQAWVFRAPRLDGIYGTAVEWTCQSTN